MNCKPDAVSDAHLLTRPCMTRPCSSLDLGFDRRLQVRSPVNRVFRVAGQRQRRIRGLPTGCLPDRHHRQPQSQLSAGLACMHPHPCRDSRRPRVCAAAPAPVMSSARGGAVRAGGIPWMRFLFSFFILLILSLSPSFLLFDGSLLFSLSLFFSFILSLSFLSFSLI